MNTDPSQHPADGPIGDALRDASMSVDVGDAGDALDQVRATARRRGRRRTALLGLGAVAVLVAGGVVVANAFGDDDRGDDFLVSSPATTEPSDTDTDTNTDDAAGAGAATDAPADSAPPGTDAVVEESASEPPPTPAPEPAPASDGWMVFPTEHVVAWNGGFLRFGTEYTPQPLPDELPEEIRDLFSQEVLDLFADGLPDTVDEATSMLREAGLLDEVTDVLAEHPEANDAILAVPSPAPDLVAEFSPVGAEGEWTPIEMTAPLGLPGIEYAVSTGDRLVVAATEYESTGPDTGPPAATAVVLASTTDLVTWTEQRLDVPRDPGTPDYVTTELWLQGLAADDTGWIAGIGSFVQLDVAALVPDLDLDEGWMSGGSYVTDDGVEAYYYDPETGADQTLRFTWDELGIEPIPVGQDTGVVASGTWAGGPPRFVDSPGPGGLVAVDGGFLSLAGSVRFSPDGVTWTDVEPPVDDPDDPGYPMAALTVEGGAVVLYGDRAGAVTGWRLDTPALTWSDAGFPAPPVASGLSPHGSGSGGPATVLMADEFADVEPTTVVLEDGTYRLEITAGPLSWSYTLTELASGAVVAAETASDPGPDGGFEWFVTGAFGAIEVSDPATGEVVVTFTGEELNAAFEAAAPEPPPEVAMEADPPELWLVATDGTDWLVEQLDTGDQPDAWWGPVHVVAVDGEILVATFEGEVTRLPL